MAHIPSLSNGEGKSLAKLLNELADSGDASIVITVKNSAPERLREEFGLSEKIVIHKGNSSPKKMGARRLTRRKLRMLNLPE